MRYYLVYPVSATRAAVDGLALGDTGYLPCTGWWGECDIDAQQQVSRSLQSRPDLRAALREEPYALFREIGLNSDRYELLWPLEKKT